MSEDYEPETVLMSLPAWNSMVSRNHELQERISLLEEKLDAYESDYTICDCCECLTPDPVDAEGHTQCKSCTRISEQDEEIDAKDRRIEELKHDLKIEQVLHMSCKKLNFQLSEIIRDQDNVVAGLRGELEAAEQHIKILSESGQ